MTQDQGGKYSRLEGIQINENKDTVFSSKNIDQ